MELCIDLVVTGMAEATQLDPNSDLIVLLQKDIFGIYNKLENIAHGTWQIIVI